MIEKIRSVLDKDVSAYPELWASDNPTIGCCIPVALLVQDFFGGELVRVSLQGTPFHRMRYHWFNLLSGGLEIDYTREQFDPFVLGTEGKQPQNRKKALAIPGVEERYKRLRDKLDKLR